MTRQSRGPGHKATGGVRATPAGRRRKSGGKTPWNALEARDALETATLALLGRTPRTMQEYAVVGQRMAWTLGREKPYTASYMRNLLLGLQPMTPRMAEGAKALTKVLNSRLAENYVTVVRVCLPAGVDVEENALVLSSAVRCPCGLHFVPRVPNQRYHSRLCKWLGKRALAAPNGVG